MRRFFTLMAAVALFWSSPAPAQNLGYVQNFVDLCNNTRMSPRSIIQGCTQAITSGRLSRQLEAQAFINRGVANIDREEHVLSLRDFDEAIKRVPNLFEAHLNRGGALRRLGKPIEALAAYNRGLLLRRDDRSCLIGRGAALLAIGADQAAADDFTRAIAQDPDEASTYFNRGLARLGLRDGAGAMADFTVIIEDDPTDASAYYYRAQGQELRGDLHQAYLDYGRAIAIDGAYAKAYFRRGRLLYGDEQAAAAAPDLKRAYDLGYNDPWLAQYVVTLGR